MDHMTPTTNALSKEKLMIPIRVVAPSEASVSGTEYQVNDEGAETGVSVGDDNWMPIYFFNYND